MKIFNTSSSVFLMISTLTFIAKGHASDPPQVFYLDDIDVKKQVSDYRIMSESGIEAALLAEEVDKATWLICQALGQPKVDFTPFYWTQERTGEWEEANMSQKRIGDALYHIYDKMLADHMVYVRQQNQSKDISDSLRQKNYTALAVLTRIQDNLSNQWSNAFAQPPKNSS